MLTFAPTPIGNIEDLSFRALNRLAEAEVFFCEDTRVTKKLLSILKKRFGREFFKNPLFIPIHSHNEESAIASLDPAIFSKPCVYVSDAGMPCVSDPGAKLALFCLRNGVDYEVLPGANAAITAFAASGCEQKFIFCGFLPIKTEARRSEAARLLSLPFAIIFYESPRRIAAFADLIASIAPDRPVRAFKELTKSHESKFAGSAAEFALAAKEMNLKGEWTIVVFADFAAPRQDWLIEELSVLPAPVKPLSKILAKLSGESAAAWYEKLRKSREN